MTCEEFITQINQQKIKAINFRVDGYGHYRQCRIGWDDDQMNIVCRLTPDGKETIYFCGALNPDSKIFYFGHAAGQSLTTVWPRIIITEIESY